MDLQKFITICVVCTIIGVNFVLSLPTFGNEYVHIKVHIPHETSSTKGILKPKHPVTHHVPNPHGRHKVIHHYHHHRKPVKKLPIKETAPLLENVYLAELDKPRNHGPKHVEETYLVTEEHHHSKPIEKVKTIKVIEEYEHRPEIQPHPEYAKNHVKTIKLIETKDPHLQHHHHHEDHDHHVETVKFVEEKPQYHYQQESNYHVPKEEVLNVVQTPKYTPSAQNYGHYAHEPQVEEIIEEEHSYHAPQTNIVASKPTTPKGYYNKNYDPEDQLLHGIIEESLEIIKTKKAKNHNYQTYYGFQPPKEHEITKPQEEYHNYQVAPETNHHYKHEPEVIVEQHIEYDKPANLAPHQHYGPPPTDYPEYEKPSSAHNFAPHQHYGAPKPDSSLPHEYENPTSGHHYALHQQYGPPKPDTPESVQHYSQHSATYQATDSYENKQKFAADYQQYLPSSETPPDFNEPIKGYEKQNTLYDDLNPKDDYSNAVENPNAPETYTGYDSYSAGHVQGLGSGGYRHHTP